MTKLHLLAGAGLLALAGPAVAQFAQAPAPMSDADRLSAEMRLIGINPRDVAALTEAGELSLKLGDLSGAASLFARADKVDPRNGRVKAGMADVLLRNERPGEALLYFDQAEGYGWPVAHFAADRGLAYDLTGQQGRAQRDYRTALATAPDAEVTRRYALSLAISGQKDAALAQLDPLVRANDRGAWRARAFVLAMTGDTAGATAIATRMMAPGQAQGLAPFFGRLPTLGPVDRAFAVHFGEVRATPQRLADARMAPALPPMAPEVVATPAAVRPTAPVQVAATTPPKRRRGRDVQVAAAAPVQVPAPTSPVPPASAMASARPVGPPVQMASARPALPAPVQATVAPRPLPAPGFSTGTVTPSAAAARAAYAVPATADVSAFTEPFRAARIRDAAAANANRQALSGAVSATIPAARPAVATPVQLAATRPATTPTPQPTTAPAPSPIQGAALASAAPATASATTPPPANGNDAVLSRLFAQMALPGDDLARAGELAAHPELAQAETTAPPATTPLAHATATTASPNLAAHREAGSAPTRHVAPVTVRSEPAVETTPRLARATQRTTGRGVQLADADTSTTARHPGKAAAEQPAPDRDTAPLTPAQKRAAARKAAVADATEGEADASLTPAQKRAAARGGSASKELAQADTDVPLTAAQKRAASRKGGAAPAADEPDADAPLTPAQKRAADRKAAAAAKAAEAKKAAAEQAKEEARQAAEAKKAAKAEPVRYWVQVAGGANEAALPKAWAQAQEKATALKGRSGWTTPLRATNRVLAGPFKTDEEARAFMGKVRAQGIQAWQFTSEAGQKVSKLPE